MCIRDSAKEDRFVDVFNEFFEERPGDGTELSALKDPFGNLEEFFSRGVAFCGFTLDDEVSFLKGLEYPEDGTFAKGQRPCDLGDAEGSLAVNDKGKHFEGFLYDGRAIHNSL